MKMEALIACGIVFSGMLVAPGQDFDPRPSHRLDPHFNTPSELKKILGGQIHKNKGQSLDSEMISKLLKLYQGGELKPENIDLERLQQFLKNNPEFQDPQKLDQLRDLVRKQMQERKDPENKGKVDWNNMLKKVEEMKKKSGNNPPKDGEAKDKDPQKVDNPTDPQASNTKKSPSVDRLTAMLEKISKDSPKMKKVMKNFMTIFNQNAPDDRGILDKLAHDWRELDSPSQSSQFSPKDNRFLENLQLPEFNYSLPSLPMESGFDSQTSQLPTSFSNTGFGSWITFISCALFGGGFLIYWYYRHKAQRERQHELSEARRLQSGQGHAVQSRDDVILVFEYLTLKKCGQEALNWHHRQVAQEMSDRWPEKKESIDRLANLYEKARYAPLHETFTQSEIEEARVRFVHLNEMSTL